MRSKIFIVLIHLLAWLAFLLIPLLFIETDRGRDRFIITGWFIQALMAGYFYSNYLVLIPRFLLKKRVWAYLALLLSGLIALSLINVVYAYFTYDLFEHRHPFSFWWAVYFPFYPLMLAFALSSTVRITIEWFKNEQKKKEMESEKLNSELAFLKSQINPHFLFNTLNNICSLARKKSDETENAIIKLSQIMRYMLQDSREEKVNLDKEIEYLKNFIELQRIRLPESVNITFTIEGNPEAYTLEPLLLIPFVENAFKHGISYQVATDILIHLSVNDQRLVLNVSNMIFRMGSENIESGSGIGLKNVVRRLDLLYPSSHTLTMQDDGHRYQTELSITFSQ